MPVDYTRQGTVSRIPFAKWLKEAVDTYGLIAVEKRTGLNARYIHSVIKGYNKSKGKLRPIDFLDFETIDKALLAWGDPLLLDRLYPPKDCEDAPSSPVTINPSKQNDAPNQVAVQTRRRQARKPR